MLRVVPLSQEATFFKLIALYRCFAMIPPTVALLMAGSTNTDLNYLLYSIAWANTLLQTFYQLFSPLNRNWRTHRRQMLLLVGLELILCAALNGMSGIWSSPFYLYSLAPIFQSAFFYGLRGALLSATTLSVSYAFALTLSIYITEKGGNWLVSVTLLTGFFGSAVLYGYQSVISNQLRKYAATIEQYRANLEEQNRDLEQANRRLEQLGIFSRALQDGNTSAQVEHLAVRYIWQFFGHTSEDNLQLLKNEEAAGLIQTTQESALLFEDSEGRIYRVQIKGKPHLLIPLTYKDERFGALLVTESDTNGNGQEQRKLLSLLSDQLARALGSLRQSQALAIEAERARLAMDMHDVVAQSVFGIAFNLDACLKLYDREPEHVRERLNDLKSNAFDMLGSVRAIINDLWNEQNGDTDFNTLVETFIKKAGRLYPFKIQLQFSGQKLNLEKDVQKGLYRLLQEALSNAAKHSGATQVIVSLRESEQSVELEVTDNGVGFDTGILPQVGRANGGIGLAAMRERLEQLGGTFLLYSSPDAGTRLLAKLPFKVPLATL